MTDESIFTSRVAEAVTAMRKANPVTQCLTNIVVTNFTANVLLAAGASPAMVDNAQESGIFAQVAGGVLVNSGTPYPETAEAMKQAAGTAAGKWVLDPVACTLPWRSQIVRDCLAASHPAIIRGNASEILALHGTGEGARGTDAVDTTEAALPAARELARANECVVAVSGPVDRITDGTRVVTVTAGHEWMTLVTGVGCSLGAPIAGLAAAQSDRLVAATAATAMMCVAAERAARRTVAPGSFAIALIDELYLVTPDEVAEQGGIRCVQA